VQLLVSGHWAVVVVVGAWNLCHTSANSLTSWEPLRCPGGGAGAVTAAGCGSGRR
jgi:hypothetical protein